VFSRNGAYLAAQSTAIACRAHAGLQQEWRSFDAGALTIASASRAISLDGASK